MGRWLQGQQGSLEGYSVQMRKVCPFLKALYCHLMENCPNGSIHLSTGVVQCTTCTMASRGLEEGGSGREKEGPLGPVREVGKAVVRDKGTGLADIFSLS